MHSAFFILLCNYRLYVAEPHYYRGFADDKYETVHTLLEISTSKAGIIVEKILPKFYSTMTCSGSVRTTPSFRGQEFSNTEGEPESVPLNATETSLAKG
jgi:hypothetical protein